MSEVGEAVGWQLSTIFPLQPEDIYYDWKLLSQSDEATKVIVTAISKKLLDGIILACEQAHIKPISFESSASVLARAISPLPERTIITEVDSLGSSTSLIEDSVVSITTTTNYTNTADGQGVIQNLCYSISQLINRVKEESKGTMKPILYLTGEKSSATLVDLISKQVNEPIIELMISGTVPSFHLAYIESKASVELPESEKSINLLPETLQERYRLEAELSHAKKITRISAAIGVVTCFIAIAVFVTVTLMNQQASKQLASIADPPAPPTDINQQLLLQKAQKIVAFQPAKNIPSETLAAGLAVFTDIPIRQFDYTVAKKEIKISLATIGREK
jgi:hypothetical protein